MKTGEGVRMKYTDILIRLRVQFQMAADRHANGPLLH